MMSKNVQPENERPHAQSLAERLREPRKFIQIIAGARQVGKTTLVNQVLARLALPYLYVSADEPTLRDTAWLTAQWERARLLADDFQTGAVLAVDEIQKVRNWSETVKRLWDEDSRSGSPLKAVLLGSSQLLMQQGLTESLAGRFEVLHLPHWSFAEMRGKFGYSLEQYLYFGGYPGAAALVDEPGRWRRYLLDSLIETTIARDVLLMTRVDKPVLLRRLFELGCQYSGQELSYTKMLGQLQDAGNTVTLAHYLDLLSGAGMLTGLQKYAGRAVRRRGSSPKLQVYNTALMTAQSGLTPAEAFEDREYRGRLVESAVGAHLVNAAAQGICTANYWRSGRHEVDYVIHSGRKLVGIEVKSGTAPSRHSGLEAFADAFKPTRTLLVGGDGIPVEEFLTRPVEYWM